MSYNIFTLNNGLRVIHEEITSPVCYCGFAINVGTRDEYGSESGMAHLVEHLIFKGTTHRRAWHILNRLENVGGELNAYTTKEETVVYSAFLTKYFTRAVELLTDIVFNSTFPEEELEKEIEVIIDEINSYKDSPSELIYDEFETMLFKGHPLGRDILGNPERLRQYKSKDVYEFVKRYYTPSNMIFFVRGNLSPKRVESIVNKFIAEYKPEAVELSRLEPQIVLPEYKVIEKDTHQVHVMIGGRSYSYFDKRRTTLLLLNNLLGGPGMNSKLNVSLREKHGLVYGVDSSITTYTDSGVFGIYYGIDDVDLDKSLKLVHKELKKLREQELSPLKLSMAKKQLIGQIGISSDNNESLSLGIARTFLHKNRCDAFQTICDRITSITAKELQQVALDVFAEEKLSTLIYK